MPEDAPGLATDIVKTLREPLLVLGARLRIKAASSAFYRVFQVKPDETIGRHIYELGDGQWNIPALRKLLDELLPTNGAFDDYPVEHDFPGIGPRTMLLNARRLPSGGDRGGETKLILLAIEDVTEGKAAERALAERARLLDRSNDATEEVSRQSAERFKFLAESMPQKIFTATAGGDVAYFNRRWMEYTGLTFEQIKEWGWTQFIHPDDVEENVRVWKRSIETGEPFQFEHRFRRADGAYRWHLSRAHLMLDADDNSAMWLGSNTDIDDVKQAEEALRESNQRVTNVVESITDAFITLDKEWRFTYLNHRAEEILLPLQASPREKFLGKNLWEHIPDLLGTPVEENYRRCVAERVTVEFELFYPPLNAWFQVRAYPSKDGISIYFQDISERKRAQLLEAGQKGVLEHIARDAPLSVVLEAVVRMIEEQSGSGMIASVLLLDEDGIHLRHGAAPNLPEAYNRAIDGIAIGPKVGSCGTAAHLRKAVYVSDIANDPLWADFAKLAAAHRLRACWSTPILSSTDQLLGTLAMYYPQVREPNEHDLRLVETATRNAAIAIERKHAEQERKALLASEQAARVEAEAANRAKDIFLATLSHEIRTPLNAIVGWMSILRTQGCKQEDLAEGLDVIERSTKAQVQLIEDVMDVSRIVAGKLQLHLQSCGMSAVIQAALDVVRPAADAKRVTLEADLDPSADRGSCDPNRMQQVVWNLLANAVKFTPKNGKVTVTLIHERSMTRITVSDTGAGIAPEFLPHVFERFQQADAGSRRQYGGLGLGLSIVKHIVELHGGTARVESAGSGKGSTFTIDLPVRAVHAVEAPEQSDEETGDAPPDPAGKEVEGRRGGQGGQPPSPSIRLDGLRVLAVDDEADARRLVAKVLEDAGATVTVAASAAEALEALSREIPDLLVSDLGMPEMDGYDLIRQVRQRRHTGDALPAVALTAYAHRDDERRALLAGFQVHVPKPVDPHDLIAVVASLARRTG